MTPQDKFILQSVNKGRQKPIPLKQISDSLREVWIKIYNEKNKGL